MASVYKHSILIVDDDADVRETLETLMTAEGYAVSTAEHGLKALSHLNTAIPDVIVSDLHMPQMSGFEFLSVVRRRFPQVAVIASSGAYMGDDIPSGVIVRIMKTSGKSASEAAMKAATSALGQMGAAKPEVNRTPR